MSFLIISYFLTLSFEEEINRKNILIFYFFVIILSIIKPNYIFFSFLGLLIPPNKLEKNDYLIIIFGIISSFIIVLCWTHYSVDALNNSWRAGYFNGMHVNPKEQLDFVLTHKKSVLLLFSSLIYEIPRLIGESFKLSVDKFSYNSPILSWLYGIFFTIFMFLYPIKLKITKKTRLCLLLIVIMIFIGTYFIQYLTWMSVGVLDFSKCGVFPRYFIPLIPLLPLIFNIDINRLKLKNINMWLVVLIITFLFGLLSMIVNQYYFI